MIIAYKLEEEQIENSPFCFLKDFEMKIIKPELFKMMKKWTPFKGVEIYRSEFEKEEFLIKIVDGKKYWIVEKKQRGYFQFSKLEEKKQRESLIEFFNSMKLEKRKEGKTIGEVFNSLMEYWGIFKKKSFLKSYLSGGKIKINGFGYEFKEEIKEEKYDNKVFVGKDCFIIETNEKPFFIFTGKTLIEIEKAFKKTRNGRKPTRGEEIKAFRYRGDGESNFFFIYNGKLITTIFREKYGWEERKRDYIRKGRKIFYMMGKNKMVFFKNFDGSLRDFQNFKDEDFIDFDKIKKENRNEIIIEKDNNLFYINKDFENFGRKVLINDYKKVIEIKFEISSQKGKKKEKRKTTSLIIQEEKGGNFYYLYCFELNGKKMLKKIEIGKNINKIFLLGKNGITKNGSILISKNLIFFVEEKNETYIYIFKLNSGNLEEKHKIPLQKLLKKNTFEKTKIKKIINIENGIFQLFQNKAENKKDYLELNLKEFLEK